MDTQTRHALKKDKFAQAAASSASWIGWKLISTGESGVNWLISPASTYPESFLERGGDQQIDQRGDGEGYADQALNM